MIPLGFVVADFDFLNSPVLREIGAPILLAPIEETLAACRTGWVEAKNVGNEISFSRVSSE